jgi:inhibitor of KinA sporulation pathway (predicted exonuclease)
MNPQASFALPREGQVVVFDLEWTAWEGSLARNWGGPGEFREVIQIGALSLEAATFHPLESFAILVKPVFNPGLSDYIQELTGITNEDVQRDGMDYPEALEAFRVFLGDRMAFCNGRDGEVLEENSRLQGVQHPFSAHRFANLRPLLAQATGLPPSSLVSSELPVLLGIGPRVREHTGDGDARAIGLALRALRARGAL